MDNCGQFLGGTNLDAHINESKKSRKKTKTQIAPSSSFMYWNNYSVITIVI